jgi:SOS-response transcriptional repressor LexA
VPKITDSSGKPYARIGQLVRNLRLRRGMSQFDLASASGINNSYLSRIENGERRPSPKILKKFSELLQYPYDELIVASGILSEDFVRSVPIPAMRTGPATSDATTEALRQLIATMQPGSAAAAQMSSLPRGARRGIPVFDTVPAGLLKDANVVEARDDIEQIILTEDELAYDPKAFAMVVKGDSMTDVGILDGDVIIVSPTTTVASGDIAVVQVDHATTTVKLVFFEDNHVVLQAANSAYKPIILSYPSEVEVLGKVILVRRKLI